MKRIMMLGMIILALLLTLPLAGCGGPQKEGTTSVPKQSDYPNVESRLFQLATAENPAEFAKANGLDYFEMVRVIIVLNAPDASVPEGIRGLVVEGRTQEMVQALVPVQSLLELSKQPQVKLIRSPSLIKHD
jgi:hypothetical protein